MFQSKTHLVLVI